MSSFFTQLMQEIEGTPVLKSLVEEAFARSGNWWLVAARWTGLLGVGPFVGRSFVTWPVRIGLILFMTLVVAPTLPTGTGASSGVKPVRHTATGDITFDFSVSQERTFDWLGSLFQELMFGALIGVGVATVLGGLKLGGELLDRHSGLGFGGVLNPEFETEGTASAEMLVLFGTTAILMSESTAGHLRFLRVVLELFRTAPVGSVSLAAPVDLLHQCLRQSLTLGLRVALPFVLLMGLVDLALSFAGRSSRWSLQPATMAARTGVALIILTVMWPGVAEAVSAAVMDSLPLLEGPLT